MGAVLAMLARFHAATFDDQVIVLEIVLQKSTPTQIRQLVHLASNCREYGALPRRDL